MKQIFFLVFWISMSAVYGQQWNWAINDTAVKSSYYCGSIERIAKDSFGNLIIAHTVPKSNEYKNCPSVSILVIKYNPNHVMLWKQEIVSNRIGLDDICTDVSGNIFIVSNYSDTIFIGSDVFPSVSGSNMSLIKFNSQGVFQWMKYSTGAQASGNVITTDAKNNVYMTGRVFGNVNFDSVNINTPAGSAYVSKYGANGNLIWIKSFAKDIGGGNGMKTDVLGNSYLAGTFSGAVQFDAFSLTAYGGTSDYDIYIAKIDSSGNWLWAKSAGGSGDDKTFPIAIDKQGNSYITGYTESSTIKFGTISIVNNTGIKGDDYILAKYDSNGNVLWARIGGGIGTHSGNFICVNKIGEPYINVSDSNLIMKFDSAGNYLWTQNNALANLQGMIADNSSNIYIIGDLVNDAASFDSFYILPGYMFVARLYDPSSSTSIQNINDSEEINVYPNPSAGIFTLHFANKKSAAKICVYDLLGNCVLNQFAKNDCDHKLDLSNQSKGVYFIEMVCDDSKAVKKIIIQ